MSSALFTVPYDVGIVRVVAIGGGGGGVNGHQPGGGGGYVECGTFSVTSGSIIPITVGSGGTGALTASNNNVIGNTNGTASSFGTMLVARGGNTSSVSPFPGVGSAGGSGSGCPCVTSCCANTYGGSGGSGGSNGSCTAACAVGGLGQGTTTYAACLRLAKIHTLSAEVGGIGGLTQLGSLCQGYGPSGGGGGILVDGAGPSAGNGAIVTKSVLYIYI